MARQERGRVWAVVLAAGEGNRMAQLTRALYGHELPKQFAALDGERTLLQRTLERIAPVAPPERTVVVVSEGYEQLCRAQLRDWPGIEIVTQPLNLGTGPGILLPLAHVRARDPRAEVAIFPSDHHVRRAEPFVESVLRALRVSGSAESGVALLGAAAERAAVDLGWIVRGERLGVEEDRAFQVHRFVEKPPEPVAMLLLGTGSLWNTFVLAGTASALWKLAGRHIQHQVHAFDAYAPAVGGMDELAARARLYRELMPADFSREVLQVARGLGVVPVLDSGWFDCGTPERLVEYLRATPGLEPLLMRIQNALGRSGPRKAAAAIASAAA